jgi:putative FmdB family regulatory protein
MPIYEYKCTKCQKEFEVFQNITDDNIPPCKFCQGAAKKMISRSSFHLKGSGWYVTDYGGKKPSTHESKEEKSESTPSDSSSESSTESSTDSSSTKSDNE